MGSETDAYDPRADRVALMTLHTAKGLEFPVVFIVGCEEGLLPYVRPDEATDIEEERRLFYVGLTRAQRKLVLTHARTRFLYGQRKENPISRFVKDIEDALKEIQEMQRRPGEEAGEHAVAPILIEGEHETMQSFYLALDRLARQAISASQSARNSSASRTL